MEANPKQRRRHDAAFKAQVPDCLCRTGSFGGGGRPVVQAQREPRASMASQSRSGYWSCDLLDCSRRVDATVHRPVSARSTATGGTAAQGDSGRRCDRGDPPRTQTRCARRERDVADLDGRRMRSLAARGVAMVRIDALWPAWPRALPTRMSPIPQIARDAAYYAN